MKLNDINKHTAWLIFIFGLVVFTIGHGSQELINFETRFALFAQDMFRHGIGFFPTIYGQPYPDYTSASTLLIYLCSLPFGEVTKFSACLPTAMVSSLILVFIYKIAALHDKRWGIFSVCMAVMTVFFFNAARSISMDQFTSLFAVMIFYLLYQREIADEQPWSKWVFVLMFLALVFRGPIGLVQCGSVACVYFVLRRKWSLLLRFLLLSALLLTVSLLLLLGIAYLTGGDDFLHQVVNMQVIGRLSVHKEPFSFYFHNALSDYAVSFDIAIISMIAVCFKQDDEHNNLLFYLFGVVAILIIGMTIPGEKKTRYILAIVPAISLMSGYMFAITTHHVVFRWIKRLLLSFFLFLPLIAVSLLSLALIGMAAVFGAVKGFSYIFIVVGIACIVELVLVALCFKFKAKRAYIAIFTATLTFIAANLLVVEPIILAQNSAKPFVTKVEDVMNNNPGKLYFYKMGDDGAVIKYLVNVKREVSFKIINTTEELADLDQSAYIIIDNKDLYQSVNKKQYKVLQQGKFGRHDVVLIKRDD